MRIDKKFDSISGQDIMKLESLIGLQLPEDYKAFLLKYNGGVPELNLFHFKMGNTENTTDIQYFFGISKDTYNIQDIFFTFKRRLPQNKIAVARDSGGNLLVIDVISSQTFLFDHETDELYFVSDTFSHFLTTLFEEKVSLSDINQAIVDQDISYFEAQISLGANINDILNEFKQPVFIVACLYDKLKMVQFFVKNGADIKEGLYSAASNGHLEVIKHLLEIGADPNERTQTESHKNTALLQASSLGFHQVVQFLISKGASVHLTNTYSQTALDRSRWSDNQELIQFLEKLTFPSL